jgi:ABC-type branched-subunit amino acid transport system ATPase component
MPQITMAGIGAHGAPPRVCYTIRRWQRTPSAALPAPPMSLLEIRNVTRRFGEFTAVDRVSLSIEAGEFFTLLGPSGCGKTTLLRMIAGFDLPDEGSIFLNGSRSRRQAARGAAGAHRCSRAMRCSRT